MTTLVGKEYSGGTGDPRSLSSEVLKKMSVSESFRLRYFRDQDHPYRIIEAAIIKHTPERATILDAGGGRAAERLKRMKAATRAERAIAVDLESGDDIPDVEFHAADLAELPVETECVDLAYSVSVFEHLPKPQAVLEELFRVLRPGSRLFVLTPNFWDYGSLISHFTPNRWHGRIVAATEGRAEQDVFPTYYRANTKSGLHRLSERVGFEVIDIRYLGQYPSYFLFSYPLFILGTMYQKVIETTRATQWLQGWIFAQLRKPSNVPRKGI